ncbi:hypothetical protein LG3211_0083 [Lysobacter gummosus]|nr:hypothetical protein LG3211_0083 [Lysobacter gummosus]
MQIFAVALLLAPRVLSFAPTLTELRYLAPISLVLFICAGAVVRDSIQFSDAFGQSKGYVSQGQRCSAR